ncbi:MAG: gliding motility-associated C-terminal domain-containing protein, partial [Bacteroidota bacterium]
DITEPLLLEANATGEMLLCSGDTDGNIDLTVTGGTPGYTFAWDNGSTDEDPSGLGAGTYCVTVTDNNGCTATACADITEPLLLESSATGEMLLCSGDTDGDINLIVTGGTPGYTFAWDNGATDEDPSGLGAGIYCVTVTDNNGCTATACADITEPDLLSANAVGEMLLCNGDTDGDIDLTVTGGTIPYTYNWDNGSTDEDPSGLVAGTYCVTVTDNNGCTATACADVTEPGLLAATATGEMLLCNGDTDGDINLTVTGGIPGYTFTWDNGSTDEDPSGLAAGTYCVTVTDNNGCTATACADIAEPPGIAATIVEDQPVLCNGESNGQATVTAMGGTPGYSYEWDNNETGQTASNLDAGPHTVTITDANGCSIEASVMINEPAAIILTVVEDQGVLCNGESNGQATVSVSGGTPDYTFEWDSGETTATATMLDAGPHTVTVTDSNNCSETAIITISEPGVLGAAVTTSMTSCFGGDDGSAMAVVSGGTMPYTYNWDNGETNNPAINLMAGSHGLTVTDANGCETTAQFEIGSPTELMVDISATSVNCFGGSDGTASVAVSGGTPAYTYNWSNSQTNQTATGLSAGNYTVTVTDANSCEMTASVDVTEPVDEVMITLDGVDPLCWSGNDGSATATVNGGTPDYTYIWNNGQSEPTATGLSAGSYTVTVTDANGCVSLETIQLGQPDPIQATLTESDVLCFGDANGTITVDTAFGGLGPYIYSLDGDNFQTSDEFNGLLAGSYTVWIQDINGCEITLSAFIDEPSEITVNLGADIEVLLGESVQLNADISPNIPVTYEWIPPNFLSCSDCPDPVATPLDDITYTLIVTDENGCTASDDIFISVDKDRDVYIPNAFTPNDDGINDVVIVYGNQGVAQVRIFRIYDRWGEFVFEATNFDPNDPLYGWNGTFKGKPMNPAVFVYYAEVEFVDGVVLPYKGDITLIR